MNAIACEDNSMIYDGVDTNSLYPVENEDGLDGDNNEEETDNKVRAIFPVGLDCEWKEELATVVDANHTTVFVEMSELLCLEVHHTTFTVKLFLRSMGGYIYPAETKEWIKHNFVHKDVFSLVTLGVKEAAHLLSSVMVINKLLVDKGWDPFTDKMLVCICARGAVWIQAEYGLGVRQRKANFPKGQIVR
jgi:hypothetical protein